jgi:2-keto-myo-inositol isomerase
LLQTMSGAPATDKMALCLHQTTSAGAGFRKSLEGWSRAGIRYVELTAQLLDDFLKTDTLESARRLVRDLGLTPVSCTAGLPDFWNPNPGRAAALEIWKRRCEQFSSLGLKQIYNPTVTTLRITSDDYKRGPECMREAGELARQFQMTAMIEFVRNSSYISTLTTLLELTREAAHPNVRPMLDLYHFWSGMSKFEDLELLQTGELGHVHFQDVPDMPRESLDSTTRLIPGDGVSPLRRMLAKLAEKGYHGPLSVELFLPEFQKADPYELARRIRTKAEDVMRQARVA